MLTRNHLFTLGFAALTVPLAACFVTVTDDDSNVGGFGGEASTSVVTSGTGSTSATGSTTSSTGTGMTTCTDPAGTGVLEATCDDMANFPATCPSTQEPPQGFGVCHHGYHVYTQGSAEDLEACLSNIPTDFSETCDENAAANISACVDKVYANACDNADAVTTCNSVAQACADGMDPNFTTDMCKLDLNPFGTEGLNAYITCANDNPMVACAELHDFCVDQVLSF